MRKIFSKSTLMKGLGVVAAFLLASGSSSAQEVYYLNQNQTGFNLPGVALPQGQDEVRASDGTSCRSAVGGSGAYLDVGAIDNTRTGNGNVSTYGRVVVPLGRSPKRLDCSHLYRLEVERLQMELELLKMGVGRERQADPETVQAAIREVDWSAEQLRGSQ